MIVTYIGDPDERPLRVVGQSRQGWLWCLWPDCKCWNHYIGQLVRAQ